jgi:hypothetical protein
MSTTYPYMNSNKYVEFEPQIVGSLTEMQRGREEGGGRRGIRDQRGAAAGQLMSGNTKPT